MLIFSTPSPFDLRSLTIMGLNAKPSTSSPIGYFGTGLKYALAVLAREGCQVSFLFDGQKLDLRAVKSEFRDQLFEALYLGPHQLPFTIELGKNWTPLMAYRELVTNTRDENGEVLATIEDREDLPSEGLLICVSGEAIEATHREHSSMFLDQKQVIETIGNLELCEGESSTIFYKGVNVGKLALPLPFTCNFTQGLTLTEDRTWRDIWNAEWELRVKLGKTTNKRVMDWLTDIKSADSFLGKLNWRVGPTFSSEFLSYCLAKIKSGEWLPLDLMDAVNKATGHKPARTKAQLNSEEASQLVSAIKVLQNAGYDPMRYEIEVVERLDGAKGLAERTTNTITLVRELLSEDLSFLVAVLFEEFCHLRYGFYDESLEFQQFLVKKIGTMLVLKFEREGGRK